MQELLAQGRETGGLQLLVSGWWSCCAGFALSESFVSKLFELFVQQILGNKTTFVVRFGRLGACFGLFL